MNNNKIYNLKNNFNYSKFDKVENTNNEINNNKNNMISLITKK